MPATRNAILFRISLALLMTCCGWARAAELGEPVVQSHIGQPLIADIELTMLADPADPVAVHLSSPDVYREANIGMHPVLSGMTMAVQRREGRQFLHITSVKPVDADHLLLFVDLLDGGKRNVRSATLWLTPDPNPAPPPVAPPVPAKPPITVHDEPVRAPKAEARVLHLPAGPPPQPSPAEQNKGCAATEYKNGLLSAQVVELEEKVKTLQLALDKRSEPVTAKPIPKKVIPTPALALAKPAAKPEGGFPWLLVSSMLVLLAALGGGVFFYLRRRDTEATGWYAKLAGRFTRKPKAILLPEEDAAGGA